MLSLSLHPAGRLKSFSRFRACWFRPTLTCHLLPLPSSSHVLLSRQHSYERSGYLRVLCFHVGMRWLSSNLLVLHVLSSRPVSRQKTVPLIRAFSVSSKDTALCAFSVRCQKHPAPPISWRFRGTKTATNISRCRCGIPFKPQSSPSASKFSGGLVPSRIDRPRQFDADCPLVDI